jgi:NMD protein affecting ribosome stability and mRNA decay
MKQPARRRAAPKQTRSTRYLQQFNRDVDPYLEARKPAGSAVCPDCGAAFFRGRWAWRPPSAKATPHRCPACQRLHDRVPAAYLTLRGAFLRAHEAEIRGVVHNFEERERKEHPLKRVMASEQKGDAIVYTFTDAHLARGIAEALHHAYQGDVDLEYTKGDIVLRATWTRER